MKRWTIGALVVLAVAQLAQGLALWRLWARGPRRHVAAPRDSFQPRPRTAPPVAPDPAAHSRVTRGKMRPRRVYREGVE